MRVWIMLVLGWRVVWPFRSMAGAIAKRRYVVVVVGWNLHMSRLTAEEDLNVENAICAQQVSWPEDG